MMRWLASLAGLGAGLMAGASCGGVECGEGTFASGDDCVGFDPADKIAPVTTISPAGGRSREPIPSTVRLTTDEPARIYYTLDGSDPDPTGPGEPSPVTVIGVEQGTTLRYFAVDRAGNQEAVAEATYDSDVTPPPPVTGLTVSLAGAEAIVTWTNPAGGDYAGTVLARVADAVDVGPTPGQMYAAATALSPSLQVIGVGTSPQHADGARPPGPVRYVAWTFDDLGNYSAPVTARAEIPLGALTAQLAYDMASGTLLPIASPAGLDLSGSTANHAGTTLTLTLAVKNDTAKYFQNPKIEVTELSHGSLTNSDGSADGFPFRALGPNMLAPGATVTRDLVISGITPGATATIDLALAHHASLITSGGRDGQKQGLVDLGSGASTPPLVMLTAGPNDRRNGKVRPGLLIGGRYLDVPTTHGAIERWDLVTRSHVRTASLGLGERLNVQALFRAGEATFALLKYGGHRRTARAELIRLDEALQITGRLELPRSDDRGFTRPALSPDGTTLALALVGGILLVDLPTLTAIDPVPATAGLDLIDPGFTTRLRSVVFFDGTSGLVAMSRTGGRAAFIHRAADGYTVTPYQDASTSAKGYSLATGPDGRVWMAFASGLRAFDPATGQVASVSYASVPHGLSVVDDRLWIIRSNRTTLDQISTTGAVQRTVTLPSTAGAYGHWLETVR